MFTNMLHLRERKDKNQLLLLKIYEFFEFPCQDHSSYRILLSRIHIS